MNNEKDKNTSLDDDKFLNNSSQSTLSFEPTLDEVKGVQSKSGKARRIVHHFLKVFTIIAIAIIAFSYGLILYLSAQAESGVSGTEFMILPFLPLIMLVPMLIPLTIVSSLSLILLEKKGRMKIAWALAALIMIGAGLHQLQAEAESSNRMAEHDRVMLRDEMIGLIEACEVDSFSKSSLSEGKVSVSYVNNYDNEGEWVWKPKHAEGEYYADYVEFAKRVKPSCVVSYYNDMPGEKDDPASLGHRWINTDQARMELMDCSIKTFNYGPNVGFPAEELVGERTGIALIDHGWVKHIYVDGENEQVLVPIAREAQQKCGMDNPQFWDGRYEQL